MGFIETAERVAPEVANNFVLQRSIFAYVEAAKKVSGTVLEIGTGSGYGIEIIASSATKFVTIDKFQTAILSDKGIMSKGNIEFIQMTVPPLKGIADNSFDYVISFQVIEHIQKDLDFVKEIHRVLKNGGKFIVTTPNIKMSLTRNPWHIREYTVDELDALLIKGGFKSVERLGVYGNEKIMNYYEKNRESVRKITRFDIFNLQYNLPRQLLQIPFDILNKINRRRLLKDNTSLVEGITMEDHYLDKANDKCFDLFYVAEKGA